MKSFIVPLTLLTILPTTSISQNFYGLEGWNERALYEIAHTLRTCDDKVLSNIDQNGNSRIGAVFSWGDQKTTRNKINDRNTRNAAKILIDIKDKGTNLRRYLQSKIAESMDIPMRLYGEIPIDSSNNYANPINRVISIEVHKKCQPEAGKYIFATIY